MAITQRGLECATAADALIDGYVAWREASDDVRRAYQRWDSSAVADRHCIFAGYLAALEREQHASKVYAEKLERLRLVTRPPRDVGAIPRLRCLLTGRA